jgi:quercetin dioxygenase-like cupin family protein
MMARRKFALAGLLVALGIGVAAAYAALPSRDVPPGNVSTGTLVGASSVNVLSVDAFTRAINQAHGTNAVLTHNRFTPGQSTGWHTHPGPNIVLVVGGSLTLTDEHCNVTTYGDGKAFATGLDVHQAVAGASGADFYSLYFLPEDATVLRTDASPPGCLAHTNSGQAGTSPGNSGSAPGHNK